MLEMTNLPRIEERAAPGSFSLRDLLNGLFYYRWVALAVFGAIVLLGTLIALVLPATYVAEARLLPLSTGVYEIQDANRPTQPNQVLDPAAVVNVELQLLGSLELHRSVVRQELGPDASQAQVNKALDHFESHLHVTKASEALSET